jgi:hypothetical protein
MADELAQEILRDWERGNADRGVWMTHWQRIANYLLPNRADYIVHRAPGAKRMQWIFTSAPLTAVDQCASGLHSYLTSPYLPWFALSPDDDRLARNWRVRRWFDQATLAMYRYFNGPSHNFAAQSYELYLDLVTIGTAAMPVLPSPRRTILFSTRHMRELVCWENEEDRIDRVVRRWQFTAKQAVDQWGERAGEKALKAVADGKHDEKFWYLHRVQPRQRRDTQRGDRRNMPFESVYVSEEDRTVIDVGGYHEFPFLVPRFAKAAGEIYGRGPGMLQLPDVQMLNEFVKLLWKGAQKIVDPPLQLPDDGFIVPIKTTPGSLNYFRSGTRPTDRIAPIETKGNIEIGLELLNALIQQINRGFYLEYLAMPVDPRDPASTGKGVTATFYVQKQQSDMRLLSPMLSRLTAEFLEPLINRTFMILWRESRARRFGPGSPFPAPPEELAGQPWHAEYVSPIAIAQKGAQLDAVQRLMQTQLELRQIDPTAPMSIDTDAIMRLTAEDLNAPAAVMLPPEQVAAIRQRQAAMQQQAHEAQTAEQIAGAANQGGAALVNLAQVAQQRAAG